MRVLFLSLGEYKTVKGRGIYLDLLRKFTANGHEVYIVAALNATNRSSYQLIEEEGAHMLNVKTGRITKTNLIEKGINTCLIEKRYLRAIKKRLGDVKFDLVLYPTPPITFLKIVEFIKRRDNASAYLMLKDIFPQNAVDLGMMSKTGLRGVVYRYFRNKEKRLYEMSDFIGCMSQANVDYVLKHNPSLDPRKVEICPNSVEVEDKSVDEETRRLIREKYGIPLDKKVFIYGGNLGKPQGIPFLIECLKKVRDIKDAFFLIVGDGTEFGKLENYANAANQENVKLMRRLPRNDYDSMVGACDVGMIFLDHRFTIPNFPSRLLSYMQAKIPVLACTDSNTDIGKVITDGGFGWYCESDDSDKFVNVVRQVMTSDLETMGEKEFHFMLDHYSVEKAYQTIMSHF